MWFLPWDFPLSEPAWRKSWYKDATGYERGLAEHKASHKPMLLYFYTDWCPHCRNLDRRMFSTSEFQARFPSLIKVRVNPERSAGNRDLGNRFKVSRYPSMFVFEEDEPRHVPNYTETKVLYDALAGGNPDDPVERGSSLDERSRRNPNDYEPHYLKGVELVEQKRKVEATFEFQTALRLQPNPESYDYLAWLALEKEDWGDALDYANKLIDLDPQYDSGRGYMLRCWTNEGMGKAFEAYRDAGSACDLGDKSACEYKEQLRANQ